RPSASARPSGLPECLSGSVRCAPALRAANGRRELAGTGGGAAWIIATGQPSRPEGGTHLGRSRTAAGDRAAAPGRGIAVSATGSPAAGSPAAGSPATQLAGEH